MNWNQWNRKQIIDTVNKAKSGFFENINKMDKSLPRLGYQGGEKYYRRSGRREILKNYQYQGWKKGCHYRSYILWSLYPQIKKYEQLYVTKFSNSDEMDKFFENTIYRNWHSYLLSKYPCIRDLIYYKNYLDTKGSSFNMWYGNGCTIHVPKTNPWPLPPIIYKN